jgi:ArsR family transcriptional regulator, arsenate/arsenite/antimonite-responsive transcriptional repressor
MQYTYSDFVPIIKALSDESRLKIVDMLSCGTMCACDILEHLHITQSTLSYHMKTLIECGLINGEKDGSWMRYSLNKEKAQLLTSFLTNISNEKVPCICFGNEDDVQIIRECE